MDKIQAHYIYEISEDYFQKFKDSEMLLNKSGAEGRINYRPYYYALELENPKDVYFLVPLTSKIEKYEKIEARLREQGKRNNLVYICKVGGQKNAFVLNKMIPVPKQYVRKPFYKNGVPFKIVSKKDISEIESRAKNLLNIVKQRGHMRFQPDLFSILEKIERERTMTKEQIKTGTKNQTKERPSFSMKQLKQDQSSKNRKRGTNPIVNKHDRHTR